MSRNVYARVGAPGFVAAILVAAAGAGTASAGMITVDVTPLVSQVTADQTFDVQITADLTEPLVAFGFHLVFNEVVAHAGRRRGGCAVQAAGCARFAARVGRRLYVPGGRSGRRCAPGDGYVHGQGRGRSHHRHRHNAGRSIRRLRAARCVGPQRCHRCAGGRDCSGPRRPPVVAGEAARDPACRSLLRCCCFSAGCCSACGRGESASDHRTAGTRWNEAEAVPGTSRLKRPRGLLLVWKTQ
jgi:hypothetical protein